ncbi:MAG: DEAD/DEAH box helicase [Phaeodactylibacter sp.]|nr:DEAD/DEAH box helicase [Phaeodactylibacter sp.]
MNLERADQLLKQLDEDQIIQNFIAQSNSRYILLSVNEPRENFPKFTINDHRIGLLAFKYLSIGCSFAEGGKYEEAAKPLEIGANLLTYVHEPDSNKKETSRYYLLCSALAYYASFQYSKSFVTLRKVEFETPVANLIGLYLKKRFSELSIQINEYLLNDEYSQESLIQLDEEEAESRIHIVVVARILNFVLLYFYTGNEDFLERARESLDDLQQVAELDRDPGLWWVLRLLRVVLGGIDSSALWKTLPNLVASNSHYLVDEFIYSHAFASPVPIVELFLSQRRVLPKVLDEDRTGVIISIPTSSGKTRIAEISILQCLISNPNAKVLYLAPFRSLAHEVELSLAKVFTNLGFEVSHLYGGNQAGSLDKEIIQEAQIIIATPEKAKAIARSNRELIDEIDLVVIDEGHLLGADSSRLLLNELFLEELRAYLENGFGRILLLSAVLPNVEDISVWLTDSKENCQTDNWRPSSERFGILSWTGKSVNIEWVSEDQERRPFNRNFVTQQEKKTGKKTTLFPNNKREAIAATALRLSALGSVLIFVVTRNSVMAHARDVLRAFGENPEDFPWKNKKLFSVFAMACEEAFGKNSDWYRYACFGILCHHGGLPHEVRMPLERLMREENPPFIISTSTLGQGVNIGVSTVIFSSIYQSGSPLKIRDFWNIAGRAGRAFVDNEGKILCAIDREIQPQNKYKPRKRKNNYRAWVEDYKDYVGKRRWSIENEEKWINKYFDQATIESTNSGILEILKQVITRAKSLGVSEDLLVQLIADNDYSRHGITNNSFIQEIENFYDIVDDTLLSLDIEYGNATSGDSSEWIDDFFRNSLAAIQAEHDDEIDVDSIIQIFQARNNRILEEIGSDVGRWRRIVTTGIPYRSSVRLESKIEDLLINLDIFLESEQELPDKIEFLSGVEETLFDLPVIQKNCKGIIDAPARLNEVRKAWISGNSLKQVMDLADGNSKIITQYYSFTLPWVINGVAKYLRSNEQSDQADWFEELAVLSELGLPNLLAVKFFIAGIRSRSAASELSQHLMDIEFSSIKKAKEYLIENYEKLSGEVSDLTSNWMGVLIENSKFTSKNISRVENFHFPNETKVADTDKVYAVKKYGEKIYLCSLDYNEIIDVTKGDIDFSPAANNPAIFFEYDKSSEAWVMKSTNPNLKIKG